MARPISRQKLGYFPTPPAVVDKIRSFLGFPDRPFAALDPCCGDGRALGRLTAGTRGLTYGIELHAGRARAASTVLGRVLACGYEDARVAHGSASLLFLNPPYDQDLREDDGRALRTVIVTAPGGRRAPARMVAVEELDGITGQLGFAWLAEEPATR